MRTRNKWLILVLAVMTSLSVASVAVGQNRPEPKEPPRVRLPRLPGAPSFVCPPSLRRPASAPQDSASCRRSPRSRERSTSRSGTPDGGDEEVRRLPYTATIEAEQDANGRVTVRER